MHRPTKLNPHEFFVRYEADPDFRSLVSKQADRLVKNEVIFNVSGLVEELLGLSYDKNNPRTIQNISWDNVINLYGRNVIVGHQDDDLPPDEWDEIDDDGNYVLLEDSPEIMEWWIVTKWLFEKLTEELGEVGLEADFGYLWGRSTFGQLIAADSEIYWLAYKYYFYEEE